MPRLTLANATSRCFSRVPHVVINESFTTVHGFTGSGLSECGISGGKLSLTDSGSGGGFASRAMTLHGSTTYSYSIDYTDAGAGHGVIKFGTSANDDTNGSVNLTSTGTITGTFTSTSKATHITIVVNNASRTLKFDNLLIQENN